MGQRHRTTSRRDSSGFFEVMLVLGNSKDGTTGKTSKRLVGVFWLLNLEYGPFSRAQIILKLGFKLYFNFSHGLVAFSDCNCTIKNTVLFNFLGTLSLHH